MTAAAARTATRAAVAQREFRPAAHSRAGVGTMVGLVLRRNYVRMTVWVCVVAGLIAYVGVYYQGTFTSQKAIDDFANIGYTPSMKALTGAVFPEATAHTMGGAVVTKIWMTCAVALALGIIFLVTRNGRADEELGRTELLRARALGVHGYSLATYAVLAVLLVVIGLLTAVVCIFTVTSDVVPVALGVPAGGTAVTGALAMGLSIAGVALVALGVGAVANQIAVTGRGANALGAVVIGVFYVIRMYGDLSAPWALWASPMGWGERMGSYGANNFWPLALMVGLAVVLVAVALRLEARRDYAAGLLPDRPGPADASRHVGNPVVLGLRLERGALVGWSVVVVLAAAMFGSLITSMTSLLQDANSATVSGILRSGSGGANQTVLLSMLVMFIAMIVGAFALQSVQQLRSEEANGTLEPQLAGALGRVRWAVGRLAIPVVGSVVLLLVGGLLMGAEYGASTSDLTQAWTIATSALVYWPAVLVLVSVGVALFGWFPRWSIPVTWGLLGLALVLTLMGGDLPTWVQNINPFHATPYLPMESMSWGPVVLMTGIAAVLLTVGLVGWRRRDLTSA